MNVLKNEVENLLIREGFNRSSTVEKLNDGQFTTSAIYTNCYGGISRSPFVINHPTHGLTRVECRSQHQSGTTDQKFPYLLECTKSMQEPTVIVVIDGNGFKPEALKYLKDKANSIQGKTVLILDILSFASWLSAKQVHAPTTFEVTQKVKRTQTLRQSQIKRLKLAKGLILKLRINEEAPLPVLLDHIEQSDNTHAIAEWIKAENKEHLSINELTIELENKLQEVYS